MKLSRILSLIALCLPLAGQAAHLQGRLVGHYPAGTRPTTACFHPDGRLLVTDRETNSICVLESDSHSIQKTLVETGFGPWGVLVSPDKSRYYTANWGGTTVTVIDAATGKQIAQVPVGLKPSYLAMTPDGKRLFAAGNLTGDVAFIELPKLEVSRILKTGMKPMGLAVSPDGRWLYVANGASQKISRIDLKHEVVLDNFSASLASTTNLVVTPDGKKVLAVGTENRLLVIDANTGDVQKIKVGADPAGVAVTPDGTTAFVANYGAGTVSFVDLAAGEAYSEVKVGIGPIDVLTDGKQLISCNDRAGSISVYALSAIEAAAIPTVPKGGP